MSKNPFHATMIALQTPISNPLVFAKNHGQAQGPAPTKDIELRIAKTDYEKTAHHFSFSPFAIRLSQFLYWCLPKIMGRHRDLPLQRISNCEMRKRITKRRLIISHFRLSPFAFRNFSIGVCPKTGQAR
jgi:hypothetical protein